MIGRIISRFEDAGFEIYAIRLLKKNTEWFDRMYPHLTHTVQSNMHTFMLSRPLIGIVLEGNGNIVNRVRRMIGATDSSTAVLGTIRGDYGEHPIRYNCVHASDTAEAAEREIHLFFGDENVG